MHKTIPWPDDTDFESIVCDCCGSDRLRSWDQARCNQLSQCRQCGLVFTNPRIAHSEAKAKLLYSQEYFERQSRMTKKLVAARTRSYEVEGRILCDLVPQGGRILDVGGGTGLFLQSLDSRWEKHCSDVSVFALSEAKKRDITVYHGELEHLDLAGQSFDVVCFRASLHHAYSPRRCIKRAFTLLKPGGLVAVVMSNNWSGPCGRMFKAHVKSYEQAHNYLFSTSSLKRLIGAQGFAVERVSYPYWAGGYGAWTDFVALPWRYGRYLWMRRTQQLNTPLTIDFCSPTFWANYVSIYARRRH